MNRKVRYAILASLVFGIILALTLTHSSPLLYSLEKDSFPSTFHMNAGVLKDQSLDSANDITPQLQEYIDFTGPVSLNIRIHDVGQAQKDLERFGKSRGSLKNLIVRLDMNESEIQAIETNTALQKEILESLLNTSITLDALQTMEIQYNSQNNEDMLTTVRLQGNEIRKRVRGLDVRYRNATEKVIEVGTKIGLDVTKARESQEQIEQIIREIEQPKTTTLLPVDTSLIPGEDRISLFIRPDTGKYRETIEYMGISLTLRGNTTLRAEGKPITLYIDDQPVSTILTDSFGYYSTKIPLERLTAETHIVYARSATSRSVNRTLTAIPVDSITNLTLGKPDSNGNINCSGSVMANFPVRSASVEIVWDQTHVLVTKTDAGGHFMREIQLPPGRHTVIARFSGEKYPVYPSQSEPRVIDIPIIRGVETDYGQVLMIVSGIGILVISTGLAIFYLKRMSRRKIPDSGNTPDTGIFDEAEWPVSAMDNSDSMNVEETLISYYTRVSKEQGMSAASWKVYRQLAERIARDLHIKRHKALTAREMARNCRGKPYCGAFARFISAYERIRYGGQVSVKDQAVFETALSSTTEQIGDDKH